MNRALNPHCSLKEGILSLAPAPRKSSTPAGGRLCSAREMLMGCRANTCANVLSERMGVRDSKQHMIWKPIHVIEEGEVETHSDMTLQITAVCAEVSSGAVGTAARRGSPSWGKNYR